MFRRFGNCLLAMLILFSSVFAAVGQAEEEPFLMTEVMLNPLFPHEDGEYEQQLQKLEEQASQSSGGRKLRKRSASNLSEYVSYNEEIRMLRAAFVARQESIRIKVTTGARSHPALSVTRDDVCAHTGDPVEGDYLFFHYKGFGRAAAPDESEDSPSCFVKDGCYYYEIIYSMTYYTTAEQEAEVAGRISSVLGELGVNDASKTDYDRFMAIYRYIDDTVTYDNANKNNDSYTLKYTAYAAIIQGTAVCQGYSNLLYRMCLSADPQIPARIISSTRYVHAWNIAYICGSWYLADATWDESNGSYLYSHFLVDIADSEHVNWEDSRSAAIYAACGISEVNYPCSPYTGNGAQINANHPARHVFEAGEGSYYCVNCGVTCAAVPVIPVPEADLVFPSALTTIEGGAFEATGFRCIEISAGIENIASGVFTNCQKLVSIVFRNTAVVIENGAFDATSGLAFYCPPNSTAHTYASENGIYCYEIDALAPSGTEGE